MMSSLPLLGGKESCWSAQQGSSSRDRVLTVTDLASSYHPTHSICGLSTTHLPFDSLGSLPSLPLANRSGITNLPSCDVEAGLELSFSLPDHPLVRYHYQTLTIIDYLSPIPSQRYRLEWELHYCRRHSFSNFVVILLTAQYATQVLLVWWERTLPSYDHRHVLALSAKGSS